MSNIADGVHFGLSEAAYHDDDAMGSTDHKAALINAVQWQAKRRRQLLVDLGLEKDEALMTPAEREKMDGDTLAKRFGRAVHTVSLFGWEAFEAAYTTREEPPKGLLRTKEEIGAALEPLGIVLKRVQLLADFEAAARQMDLPLAADWKPNAGDEREIISERWFATCAVIDRQLDALRPSRKVKSIRQHMLTGGFPEVSVFWTDPVTGLRLKCRFDYLRLKGIIDVKTFNAFDGREIIDSFCGSVATYAYDMQAAHYLEGWATIAGAIAGGSIYMHPDIPGQQPTDEWLSKLAAAEKPAWCWLTINTNGFPEIDTMEMPQSIVLGSATVMVQQARRKVADLTELHGADNLWVEDRPHIMLEDMAFPSYITSRGDAKWRMP